MFERIIVPLDGSELAEAVLAQVRRILFHQDAEIILVRAVPVPAGAEEAAELADILQAQADKYLGGIAGVWNAQGAKVRTVARQGDAADVILDLAAEEKASLIMMSTHGRSGVSRWALGSVAERVLRASRVPVLAVRAGAGTELSFQKILVPIDATDVSLEVVAPVLELAGLFGSHVVLLNVCDGPECSIPVCQITEASEKFREAGVPVEPLMKQGDAAVRILETCREQKPDLVAMTTHGRSGLPRWMLGSVTEKVLRAAPVPLLVVRPARTPGRLEAEEIRVREGSAP